MTCDRLHALTLIAYLQLCQLSSTCIHVVIICVTVQLLILLFSLFYLQLFLLLYMHMVSSARVLSPLHTHSLWSRSDDPGFARPDIGRFVSIVQMFVALIYNARSLSPSLFWYPHYLYRFQLPSSCHYSSAIIV